MQLEAAQQAILDAGAGVLLYTKRFRSDAFLCAAGEGPDVAVGAGLLRRIGVRRAVFAQPGDSVARRLRAAAGLQLVPAAPAATPGAASAARPAA